MRLIFLRHGKAAPASIDKTDSQRPLTDDGREKLEAHYPIFARYLTLTGACQVWTSEKTRARQTAQVLCRYMPSVTPEVKSFLTEADFGDFRRAIGKCKEEDTIVVVGHEPTLSNWVREITGLDMHFKKGCGVLLYLHPKMIYQSTYIGALDFDGILNLELFLLPMEIGLYHLLKRQHTHVTECCEALLDDPEDNNYLHLLRVALRIQYALLDFIQPYCKKKLFVRADEHYQKLYTRLGDLRGIDAIIESIHRSHQWQLAPLANALERIRHEQIRGLVTWLHSPEAKRDLAEAFHLTVEALMSSQTQAPVKHLVAEQFFSRYRSIYKTARKVNLKKIEEVEALRQQCKTMRYLFEFFGPLVNVEVAGQYIAIRKLNRSLGRYCDTFYNSEQLFSYMDKDTSSNMAHAISAYQDYEKRLAENEARYIQQLLDDLPKEKK